MASTDNSYTGNKMNSTFIGSLSIFVLIPLLLLLLLRSTAKSTGSSTVNSNGCPASTRTGGDATSSSTSRTRSNDKKVNKDDECYYHDNGNGVDGDDNRPLHVPFFFIPKLSPNAKDVDTQPPFLKLIKTLDKYQQDVEQLISAMALNVEIARKTEWTLFPNNEPNKINNNRDNHGNSQKHLFSTKLEERIKRTVELLEVNYFVLERILKPFDIVLGLPSSSSHGHDDSRNNEQSYIDPTDSNSNNGNESSYESAMQILTHVVRDWSPLGRRIRRSLYKWIIDELVLISDDINDSRAIRGPILVPGAGLGRLAFDIYRVGLFSVEANEISIVMSAVANQFLHQKIEGEIHPFVADFSINEVNSEFRYQKVRFSYDDDNDSEENCENNHNEKEKMKHHHQQESMKRNSLSYTVGDFIDIYATTERRGQYGSIVTCFFIDTASNIYEYLLVIRNVLMAGGIWINVGPLQWHGNSKLNPSGDELRLIIESMGFVIHSWMVDDEAINYRHDDLKEPTRYTKYEGYKPLRFVAALPSRSALGLDKNNVQDDINKIRGSLSVKTPSSQCEFDERDTSKIVIEHLD
jgi:hypothetical protein